MTGEHCQLLESFQLYACKKIQQFHPRVPNACSLHSLGWISLCRLVQIKKLLFVRSILMMDHNDVIRVVFIERYKAIRRHDRPCISSAESIVSDLVDTIDTPQLGEEIDNMVERDHMYQKSVWKRMVWDRAWSLENMAWRIEYRLQQSLDLVSAINPNPQVFNLEGTVGQVP